MIFIALLMSLALSSERAEEVFEQITPQVAADRISECGLGEVSIRYEEVLQSEVLTAGGAKSVSDVQLACADKAASYYDLELPPNVQPRYDAIRDARLSSHFLKEAQAWLAERGLLERVPEYQAGVTDDGSFTQQIESLCGPRAKGAFQSEYGFHAISPDWAQRNFKPFEEGAEVLTCLMNATRVAGFEIGFIGNAAASNGS
jgi:hypothetical protein